MNEMSIMHNIEHGEHMIYWTEENPSINLTLFYYLLVDARKRGTKVVKFLVKANEHMALNVFENGNLGKEIPLVGSRVFDVPVDEMEPMYKKFYIMSCYMPEGYDELIIGICADNSLVFGAYIG